LLLLNLIFKNLQSTTFDFGCGSAPRYKAYSAPRPPNWILEVFVLRGGTEEEEKKKISHRQLGSLRGSSSSFNALSRRGLNPIKLAYNPSQPDGRL